MRNPLDLLRFAARLLDEANDLVWRQSQQIEDLRQELAEKRPRSPGLVLPPWALRAVAQTFGVDSRVLCGSRRHLHATRARMVFVCLLSESGWSSVAIGKALHRDHSTILHSRTRAKQLEASDVTFRSYLHHARALAVVGRDKSEGVKP